MRDSQTAHRRKDRREDTMTGMEEDSLGQHRSKPENSSLFIMEYQMRTGDASISAGYIIEND